ncbi:MAG TPA: YceH family protein [Acidisarcina sp.]|nr:YceH family protein [Acidisarcina sp.]
MNPLLTLVEARALGALIEKEITTPDYYPLSLNALMNACNQRSNREPVMDLDEEDLRQALHGLEEKRLAGVARGSDGRVSKYEHWLQEAFNFSRAEMAAICVLLLRGPQTVGEIRGRSERLFHFDELSDVQTALNRLIERDPPLVKALPRQAGTKEARYIHLFSGEVEAAETPSSSGKSSSSTPDRVQALEEQVASLQAEVAGMKQQLERLLHLLE